MCPTLLGVTLPETGVEVPAPSRGARCPLRRGQGHRRHSQRQGLARSASRPDRRASPASKVGAPCAWRPPRPSGRGPGAGGLAWPWGSRRPCAAPLPGAFSFLFGGAGRALPRAAGPGWAVGRRPGQLGGCPAPGAPGAVLQPLEPQPLEPLPRSVWELCQRGPCRVRVPCSVRLPRPVSEGCRRPVGPEEAERPCSAPGASLESISVNLDVTPGSAWGLWPDGGLSSRRTRTVLFHTRFPVAPGVEKGNGILCQMLLR